MKMKIYISGKSEEETVSDATIQKFSRAEAMLRSHERFAEVFNPTSERWQKVLQNGYMSQSFSPGGVPANAIPYKDYALLRNLMALSLKDAVYLLEDWQVWPAAKVVYAFARSTGKQVFFQRLEDAQLYHLACETAEDTWLPIN